MAITRPVISLLARAAIAQGVEVAKIFSTKKMRRRFIRRIRMTLAPKLANLCLAVVPVPLPALRLLLVQEGLF